MFPSYAVWKGIENSLASADAAPAEGTASFRAAVADRSWPELEVVVSSRSQHIAVKHYAIMAALHSLRYSVGVHTQTV